MRFVSFELRYYASLLADLLVPHSLAACACVVAYAVQTYFTYFNSKQFTRYPQPIAKSLRRALYYSNYSPDAKRALKYYKMALEQCDEHKLDPFSDDVMGIKIQLSAWLQKIGNYDGAIKVLEVLLGDCKRWVGLMEESVKDSAAPAKLAPLSQSSKSDSKKTSGETPTEEAPQETLWGKRTRVLGKAVGISVKLGELYSDEHVLEPEMAHERLIWAVETALKEMQRRSVQGVKDGEGAWMSSDAIGGALECESEPLEHSPASAKTVLCSPRAQLRIKIPVPSRHSLVPAGTSAFSGFLP